MDGLEYLPAILGAYATQSTLLIGWLVGIGIAVVRWRRHPRVSLLATIALGYFVLDALVGTAINVMLPLIVLRNGTSSQSVGTFLGVISLVRALLLTGAWGLVLAAIFGWRAERDIQPSN